MRVTCASSGCDPVGFYMSKGVTAPGLDTYTIYTQLPCSSSLPRPFPSPPVSSQIRACTLNDTSGQPYVYGLDIYAAPPSLLMLCPFPHLPLQATTDQGIHPQLYVRPALRLRAKHVRRPSLPVNSAHALSLFPHLLRSLPLPPQIRACTLRSTLRLEARHLCRPHSPALLIPSSSHLFPSQIGAYTLNDTSGQPYVCGLDIYAVSPSDLLVGRPLYIPEASMGCSTFIQANLALRPLPKLVPLWTAPTGGFLGWFRCGIFLFMGICYNSYLCVCSHSFWV